MQCRRRVRRSLLLPENGSRMSRMPCTAGTVLVIVDRGRVGTSRHCLPTSPCRARYDDELRAFETPCVHGFTPLAAQATCRSDRGADRKAAVPRAGTVHLFVGVNGDPSARSWPSSVCSRIRSGPPTTSRCSSSATRTWRTIVHRGAGCSLPTAHPLGSLEPDGWR